MSDSSDEKASSEVAEDYKSAIADLHLNSKPLITMLTMLADENKAYASAITQVVINHIKETMYKLPAMYLVDSIVKNVGNDYKRLFGNSIAGIFTGVFKEVDEKTRKKLYELRQTWNEVFPKSRLFLLDTNIHEIDPAWPITSQPRVGSTPTIHVNPNKFKSHLKPGLPVQSGTSKLPISSVASITPPSDVTPSVSSTHDIEELKKLQNEKRVLEETRKKVEKMMKESTPKLDVPPKVSESNPNTVPPSNRREFLRNFKIKKKSQNHDDKGNGPLQPKPNEKVPNIYVAPWKAKEILPITSTSSATSKDPRMSTTTLRDPRIPSQGLKDHRPSGNLDPPKTSRDPRIPPTTRDPRLANKVSGPTTSVPGPPSRNLTSTSRDPRIAQMEVKKSKVVSEKEKEPSRVRKDKDHLKTKDLKESKDTSLKREKDKKEKDNEKLKEKEKVRDKEKDKEKKEKEKKKSFESKYPKKRIEVDTKEVKNKENKDKEIKKELKEKAPEKSISPKISNKSVGHSNSKTVKKEESNSNVHKEDKPKSKSHIDIPGKSKRRDHIRPRVQSPNEENEVASVPIINLEGERPSSVSSSGSSGKRSRNERESESEDSDHYDANKPRPSLYANKKAKSETNIPPPPTLPTMVSQKQPFEAPPADTDLRQLTSQPENRLQPTESSKSGEKLIELFGKEDVDLRQLSINNRFQPTQSTSAPVPLNPFMGKPDEDMRISTTARKILPPSLPPDTLEDQSSRLGARMEVDKDDVFDSPAREDPMMADLRTKKTSFNSPHAAKWEKFREKNPEFKEYERHASIPEKMEIEEENFAQDSDPHVSNKNSSIRRGRNHGDNENFDSLRGYDSPDEGDNSEESYQYMINQLNDQLKKGDISRTEYSRCMEDIRLMVEKGKIRELQAKERGSHEDRWSPTARSIDGDETAGTSWPRAHPETSLDSRFHGGEGKWIEGGRKMGSWHRGRVTRNSGPARGGMGVRPNYHGFNPRFEDEWTGEPDLPNIAEDVLRTVYRESETRTIDIDSKPREIRTYGERAIILLDWNDPRTLKFEPVQCHIVFDGGQFVIPMSIGEDYREFKIDGEVHRVRLGVPTQELIIDGKGYQCFFGGKPITVHLAGKNRTISLDGKPPKVNIGQVRNLDFLLGKIELIINAKKIIPLYLDAKPQRFTIDGKAFVIKFIDAFTAVTINGVKFPVKFGGLPISISVRGYRRFLRFSKLPTYVIPGSTTVRGMDTDGNALIPIYPPSPPPVVEPNRPVQTFPPPAPLHPPAPRPPLLQGPIAPLPNPGVFIPHRPPAPGPAPVPGLSPAPGPAPPPAPATGPPTQVPLMMSHPPTRGIVPGSYLTSTEGAPISQAPVPQLGPVPISLPNFSQPPPPTVSSTLAAAPPSQGIDVQALLDRLVKTGIIGGSAKKEVKKEGAKETKEESKDAKGEEEEEDLDFIKEIPAVEVMFNLENLRKRNLKLIKRMYRGMQCSSCGLRYPPEKTQQYSHHLDWHFRMNKKQQDSTKKVNTRKFYLCFEDWIQYEEIEDLEERVPSMFEVEGQMSSKNLDNEDEDSEEDIPSVAVSTDPSLGVCPICHETFDQFYHQNTEEWHYKYAINVENINYHPGCHQDHLKALKQEEERLKKEEEERLQKEEEEKRELEEKTKKIEEDAESSKEKKEEEEDGPELEELRVEDEDIQEIEKVKDEKPKVEIDLTEEDDKAKSSDNEPENKIDKVQEAIQNINAATAKGLSPIRVKNEPIDYDGEMGVYIPSKIPQPILADIPIKMEIDDEDNEPPSFDIEDDDEVNGSETGEGQPVSWIAPTPHGNAQTDIASSIDGNTELIIRPETSQPSASVPKIKISVTLPSQITCEEQQNENHNSQYLNGSASTEDPESEVEDFVPPPFTVDYDLKPAFRGVKLQETPIARRGVEVSSLCSIM